MSQKEKKKKNAKEKEVVQETPTETLTSGTFIFPNGDKYEGAVVQLAGGVPERSGYGRHTSTDGRVYEGQWVNDEMNGEGTLRFPTGALYEGQFVANKFHGSGQYTWPNGSHYRGCFNSNKLEGWGEFTDTSGQVWHGNFWHRAACGLRYKIDC